MYGAILGDLIGLPCEFDRGAKTVLRRFDRASGKAIQGEPIIEAAIHRYNKDNSPENKAAVLDSIYMRMKDDGYFLLPPSEVRRFDEYVANEDYDGAISIEAYTSDSEFFMGLDEEDENANDTTEVKIYDLLSFIAKATDVEAGIDINYNKNFYLNRDMARSILARDEAKSDHEQEQKLYRPSSGKVRLAFGKITKKFVSGVRYCFICCQDYDNYCDLYHRDGKVYSVNLYDGKCRAKLHKAFPAFWKFRESSELRGKIEEWNWSYISGECVVLVHEEVWDAYKKKTGMTEHLDWWPDEAVMTIHELPKRKEFFEPMWIDDEKLKKIGDYQKVRDEIPAGWVYFGDDTHERYVLGEPQDKNILVLGVNPSTAKPEKLDPTIRNVKRIIKEKYGEDFGWIMMNLHPQRDKNPKNIKENEVWRENNLKVVRAVVAQFKIHAIWCAWGNMIDMPGKEFLYKNLNQIYKIVGESDKWCHYCIFTTKENPRHPLFMSLGHDFFPFSVPEYLSKKQGGYCGGRRMSQSSV